MPHVKLAYSIGLQCAARYAGMLPDMWRAGALRRNSSKLLLQHALCLAVSTIRFARWQSCTATSARFYIYFNAPQALLVCNFTLYQYWLKKGDVVFKLGEDGGEKLRFGPRLLGQFSWP